MDYAIDLWLLRNFDHAISRVNGQLILELLLEMVLTKACHQSGQQLTLTYECSKDI